VESKFSWNPCFDGIIVEHFSDAIIVNLYLSLFAYVYESMGLSKPWALGSPTCQTMRCKRDMESMKYMTFIEYMKYMRHMKYTTYKDFTVLSFVHELIRHAKPWTSWFCGAQRSLHPGTYTAVTRE
jgi:hypothetical protein